MKKFNFYQQLGIALMLIIVMCYLASVTGIHLLTALGLTGAGLLFILHPVVPKGSRWEQSGGEWMARFLGVLFILLGWMIAFDRGLF